MLLLKLQELEAKIEKKDVNNIRIHIFAPATDAKIAALVVRKRTSLGASMESWRNSQINGVCCFLFLSDKLLYENFR